MAAGAKLADNTYIYLRGDATTDGSVRMSYQSGTDDVIIEKRVSGSWDAKFKFEW